MLVTTARDAADLLGAHLRDAERERLAVAHLDAAGRVLAVTTRDGGADAVEMPLRQIVADALRLGASALVVAHNHPSGDPAPSNADLSMTRRLSALCCAMGFQLHDHLIFARGRCSSMRAAGLL